MTGQDASRPGPRGSAGRRRASQARAVASHVDRDVGRHQLSRVWNFSIRGSPWPSASSTKARMRSSKTSRRCASALARSASLSKRGRFEGSRRRRAGRRRVGSWKTRPVRPCSTVSAPPPSPKTTAGRPQARASSGTMPEVLDPGHQDGAAAAVELAQRLVVDAAEERDLGRGQGAQPRAPRGPCPTIRSGQPVPR